MQDSCGVFLDTLSVVSLAAISFVYTSAAALPLLSAWVTFHFFDVFFDGKRLYHQTTGVISACFVDRYFDQVIINVAANHEMFELCCIVLRMCK